MMPGMTTVFDETFFAWASIRSCEGTRPGLSWMVDDKLLHAACVGSGGAGAGAAGDQHTTQIAEGDTVTCHKGPSVASGDGICNVYGILALALVSKIIPRSAKECTVTVSTK
jgi:hypothetical protein